MPDRQLPTDDQPGDGDINAVVAGILQDMAWAQTSRQRLWGYKQAAKAIRHLDEPVNQLLQPDGTLQRIPHIGPASSRIIHEILDHGQSAIVERAVAESEARAEVERRRGLRSHFLSRAFTQQVLSANGHLSARYCGDLQMHSTWSDGSQTLEAIVAGCRARSYSYAAVTDHSAGLPIAGGVSVERFEEQHREIDRINQSLSGTFRLLKGVEANIRADGVVDVEMNVRARFDVVVAAPHSGLRSPKPQTERMIAAVSTPGIHILGHPRGRIYGSRPGITADWARVFAEAARAGVAIEIDGDPSRQDLDFTLAQEAVAAGCLFALDSDAHAVSQLRYADFALAHAALGRVPPDRIVNFWPLDRFLAWTSSRHAQSWR